MTARALTPDVGLLGNPFIAPRCIPRPQFCRAFSAGRFFGSIPRARGLTLDFNLSSASRLRSAIRRHAALVADRLRDLSRHHPVRGYCL